MLIVLSASLPKIYNAGGLGVSRLRLKSAADRHGARRDERKSVMTEVWARLRSCLPPLGVFRHRHRLAGRDCCYGYGRACACMGPSPSSGKPRVNCVTRVLRRILAKGSSLADAAADARGTSEGWDLQLRKP